MAESKRTAKVDTKKKPEVADQEKKPDQLEQQNGLDRSILHAGAGSPSQLINNQNFQIAQRQEMAAQIGRMHGNRYLHGVMTRAGVSDQRAGKESAVEGKEAEGNLVVQRDLAVAPTNPNPRMRTLSDAQIEEAITFNQGKHTDAAEIGLLRDILGISSTPADIDRDFVEATARYQAQYGLTQDGKVGGRTADRLAREITAEANNLGAGNLGSLEPEFQLKTNLETLINANNANYADYKNAIEAGTMIQRSIVVLDQSLLTNLKGLLSWNNFARCVELLGRLAPSFSDLTTDATVRAALGTAWRDSNPAVPVAGTTTQHEEGGWMYLHLITGEIAVRRAPRGAGAAINLSSPPNIADHVVVGMFHTHPNLGPGWTPGPSPQDITLDAADGVPDVVVGTPGIDPAVFQFYHSGPNRRQHLAGNRGLPGAGGGLAPQARSGEEYDER